MSQPASDGSAQPPTELQNVNLHGAKPENQILSEENPVNRDNKTKQKLYFWRRTLPNYATLYT